MAETLTLKFLRKAEALDSKYTDWAMEAAHKRTQCWGPNKNMKESYEKIRDCDYVCYWLLRCGGVL